MDNKSSLLYKLSLLAVALAAVVVLLGAYTRLVDAGLGCPDWPGCYGFLSVPETEAAIKIAEAAFPDSPVDSDKAWPEMVHRYFAGALGLLVALITVLSIKYRKESKNPVLLPVFLLGLIVFQAALGMWTVTMGLLPIIVMGHLLGGFLMLALLFLLFLKLGNNTPSTASPLRYLAMFGIFIVFAQITLGGWTSANYAAIICADFPTCQGNWLPPLDFVAAFQIETEGVTNYLGGHLSNDARVTIQWMHRVGALITLVFMVLLQFKLFQAGYKKLARWLMLVLSMQVALGISNVILSLPLVVAVAHNGVAVLLLLSLVYCVHYLGRNKISDE